MPQTAQLGPFPQSHADEQIINLGLGQPSPVLLPLAALHEAAVQSLGPGADPLVLQYGALRGYEGLRADLSAYLSAGYQIPVRAEELLITGGTSLGLSLASQILAAAGDTVVVGDPTYFLASGIFETQRLRMVGIPVDAGGFRVADLESQLAQGLRPAFVYCMPSFHNPCGVNLDPRRAERMVELAEQFDFVIVADEPYVLLHFGDTPPPCMMGYDRGRGRILSLGTFSKILAPGLRLGWVHAHPALIERLSQHGALQSGGGLNPVVSSVVHSTLQSGFLKRHVARLRRVYAGRCDALVEAIRQYLGPCQFHIPEGGYFIWLDVGADRDTTVLAAAAAERGVGFTPGARCAVARDLSRNLRLCFAFYEKDELAEGVRRMGALFSASA